jgi:hypothetical protein
VCLLSPVPRGGEVLPQHVRGLYNQRNPVVVVNCDMLMTETAEIRSSLSQNITCLPCNQSSRTEWCRTLCSDMESPYRLLLLTEGVLISLLHSSWHNFSCITK